LDPIASRISGAPKGFIQAISPTRSIYHPKTIGGDDETYVPDQLDDAGGYGDEDGEESDDQYQSESGADRMNSMISPARRSVRSRSTVMRGFVTPGDTDLWTAARALAGANDDENKVRLITRAAAQEFLSALRESKSAFDDVSQSAQGSG
jgi:hypothetical protein